MRIKRKTSLSAKPITHVMGHETNTESENASWISLDIHRQTRNAMADVYGVHD